MKALLKLLFVVLVSSVIFSSCKAKEPETPSWTSHIWEKSQPVHQTQQSSLLFTNPCQRSNNAVVVPAEMGLFGILPYPIRSFHINI
jgi:hypothetical protein